MIEAHYSAFIVDATYDTAEKAVVPLLETRKTRYAAISAPTRAHAKR